MSDESRAAGATEEYREVKRGGTTFRQKKTTVYKPRKPPETPAPVSAGATPREQEIIDRAHYAIGYARHPADKQAIGEAVDLIVALIAERKTADVAVAVKPKPRTKPKIKSNGS